MSVSVFKNTFFLSLVLNLFTSGIVAKELELEAANTSEDHQESLIDITHKRLSSSLFYLSNRIDSFFGGERADDLPNGSRLRVFWTLNKEEGTSLKGEAAIRLNIALVETEKKLKVSFKNRYEKEAQKQSSEVDQKIPTTLNTYDFSDLLRWRLKVDSGVRVDFPPDPFTRLSLLKSWLVKDIEIRPSQQVFWYLKSGLGESTKLDFDKAFGEDLLFRYENDATWTNDNGYFTFFSGPTLFKKLSENRGLSIGAKVLGISKPTWFVNDYRLDLIYRQVILRKWFFIEVNPYLHFPRERDWQRTLGFNLKFEVVVGSY